MEEDDEAGGTPYTGPVTYGPDGQPIFEPAADEIDGVYGYSRNEDFGRCSGLYKCARSEWLNIVRFL